MERKINIFWWSSNATLRRDIIWIAWENMSMSKCKGEMGFPDLYDFNIDTIGQKLLEFHK